MKNLILANLDRLSDRFGSNKKVDSIFKPEIKLTDLIYIKRGLLSQEQCDQVIKECDDRASEAAYEKSTNAVTGLLQHSSFESMELKPGTGNFKLIHQATKQMITEWIPYLESFKAFNIGAYKRHLNYSHAHRLLKYKVGAKAHPHVDWGHLTFASCTVNFNEGYEGGELVFFNGLHSVKLGRGDAIIWPADCFWVHEVYPVTKGVRYCSNSFILSKSRAITHGLRTTIALSPDELNDYQYFDKK